MIERLTELLQSNEGGFVRRRNDDRTVWKLRGPGLLSRVFGCKQDEGQFKREFLTTILSSERRAFICHADSPDDHEIPGRWERVEDSTWILPASLNLQERSTEHWLFSLGNWSIFVAAAPPDGEWPDVFRCDSMGLVRWMRDQQIDVLIASSPDDDEWLIALGAA